MMGKRLFSFILVFVLLPALYAHAKSYETDTIVTMGDYDARVKLRAQPGGSVIGQYYQGVTA